MKLRNNVLIHSFLASVLAVAAGCGGDDDDGSAGAGSGGQGPAAGVPAGGAGGAGGQQPADGPLSLVGTYTDDFNDTYTITEDTWTQTMMGAFHITQYSNQEQYVIAQNDANNQYNGGLWSRFDWTEYNGSLWICQTAFAEASEEAALAVPLPDATDPSTSGCGTFAWSELTPAQ